MKVLLDENLPHDLRHFLAEHDVFTVAFLGWHGVTNGELLARAARDGFDTVITKDTGIEHEQNPQSLPIAVVVLRAPTNALDDIRPLVPALLRALTELRPNSFTSVGMSSG